MDELSLLVHHYYFNPVHVSLLDVNGLGLVFLTHKTPDCLGA